MKFSISFLYIFKEKMNLYADFFFWGGGSLVGTCPNSYGLAHLIPFADFNIKQPVVPLSVNITTAIRETAKAYPVRHVEASRDAVCCVHVSSIAAGVGF